MSARYEFTDDMVEISGFGGGYEATCRAMVVAGLEWLDAHPEADPKFHAYENIYGICMEDNEAAKALSTAMVEPQIVKKFGATGDYAHLVTVVETPKVELATDLGKALAAATVADLAAELYSPDVTRGEP